MENFKTDKFQNNFIEINSICFKYNDNTVFNDFSLVLKKDETTFLSGKNGSGKTTLTKLIVTILKPQRGNILLFGQNTKNMSLTQAGKAIGYVFQHPERQLFASSVLEQLTFPLIFNGMSENEALKKAEEMISIFNLEKIKNSYPFFLSYGEKRKLAIASVLMHDPEYIIFDEPTASLDNEIIENLSLVIMNLRKNKKGLLIISHHDNFIKKHGERIILLEGGIVKGDYN